MKTVAGLWIDHRKAIIVTISDKGEKTRLIVSNVEKQLGRFSGKRSTASFESQLVQADDRQQRGFTKHLRVFYDKVRSCLDSAESVLIFGPGEAKGELIKLMGKDVRRGQARSIETADKMTDHQITAKVHQYFARQKKEGR
jgi:hypothetical protein